LTASWPCIESTTKSVSIGFTAAWIAFTSAIIASSIGKRPAVSTMSTSWKWRFAQSTALRAISTGFCEGSDGYSSISRLFAKRGELDRWPRGGTRRSRRGAPSSSWCS
jgi:hypothetical protein